MSGSVFLSNSSAGDRPALRDTDTPDERNITPNVCVPIAMVLFLCVSLEKGRAAGFFFRCGDAFFFLDHNAVSLFVHPPDVLPLDMGGSFAGEPLLSVIDIVHLARLVTSAYNVVEQGTFSPCPEVFEAYFIHIDGGDMQFIVPVDHETVVGFVSEIGGTVDIVHLHPSFFAVEVCPVHFSWMGHKENHTVVLPGETYQPVK